jgi:hypothetical protein
MCPFLPSLELVAQSVTEFVTESVTDTGILHVGNAINDLGYRGAVTALAGTVSQQFGGAEFERAMIQERVRAGVARPGAKANGSVGLRYPPI